MILFFGLGVIQLTQATIVFSSTQQYENLLQQLKTTEQSINDFEREHFHLEKKIKQLRADIHALNQLQFTYEKKQLELQSQLEKLLVILYSHGHQPHLKLLLTKTETRLLRYAYYLSQQQLTFLTALTKMRVKLIEVKKNLLIHEKQLKDLHNKNQTYIADLIVLNQQQKVIIKKLKPNKAVVKPAPLPKLSTNISKNGFQSLSWPLQGQIVTRDKTDVLIKAQTGTTIKAMAEGIVVFADWLRGFGLLVIIDHQNGYMSLYARNRNLYKKKGDKVKVGELIASVGQSGGHEQPGLYFAVRHNGQPLDPRRLFTMA